MSYGRGPGMDPFGRQPFGGWAQPPTYQAATASPGTADQSVRHPVGGLRGGALGVKDNYLIDAEVSFFTTKYQTYKGTAEPETSGVDVVKAILDKIE